MSYMQKLYKDWTTFTDEHPILEIWFVMSSCLTLTLLILAMYVQIGQ